MAKEGVWERGGMGKEWWHGKRMGVGEGWDGKGMAWDVKEGVWERGGIVKEWWDGKRRGVEEGWDGKGMVEW
jgi:hypothetical protein